MERAHRAPVGSFYAPGAWRSGARVELDASAAHHASVKRIAVGDPVRLINGAGLRAMGVVEMLSKQICVVALLDDPIEATAAPTAIELWAPVTDRDRMLMLAEKSVELGLASWRPILYARSRSVSPRGEGEAFREKLRLRMISALEQSGGAWLPEIHAETTLAAALDSFRPDESRTGLMLDVDGDAIATMAPMLTGELSVALGPEGGFDASERSALISHGWRPASLGSNVLRFETAGIAALAVLHSLIPSHR